MYGRHHVCLSVCLCVFVYLSVCLSCVYVLTCVIYCMHSKPGRLVKLLIVCRELTKVPACYFVDVD